jgi:hypothetical protein
MLGKAEAPAGGDEASVATRTNPPRREEPSAPIDEVEPYRRTPRV